MWVGIMRESLDEFLEAECFEVFAFARMMQEMIEIDTSRLRRATRSSTRLPLADDTVENLSNLLNFVKALQMSRTSR